MIDVESQNTSRWLCNRNQYFATIAACLISLSYGSLCGWVSPALALLSSENTPLLSGPLTNEEVSWIGSIGPAGIIFGSFLFGSIASLIGCKRAALCLSIPSVIFWIMIYFGQVYYHIILARFIGGWTFGGIKTTIIIFVSEISNDNIRGRLAAFSAAFVDLGILWSYILGTTLPYRLIPCISVILPIIFVISFARFPNTPQYHLARGQVLKAKISLMYYKNYKGLTKREENAFYKEFERLKIIANERMQGNRFQISDFCNRDALKGLGIGVLLAIFVQFTGSLAITSYAVLIIEKSGTSLNPYTSSIMCAMTPIFGSLLSTFLADKFGRKLLNFISLAGAAIGLFGLSFYQYLKVHGYDLSSSLDWIPIFCLSFVVFMAAAGILPLSIICSVENLPPKIRTFGMVLISCSISFFSFTSLKLLPILMEQYELYGCFMIYGIGCVVGAIFVLFVLKETGGQSIIGSNDRTDNTLFNQDRLPLLIIPKKNLTYHTFRNNNQTSNI